MVQQVLDKQGVARLWSKVKDLVSKVDLTLFKVVQSLPTTGIDVNKIYLVPSGTTGSQNKYTEYVYANGAWEKLGEFATSVDLSGYVKFTDLASASKAGAMSAADKTRLDGIFAGNLPLVDPVITGTWTFYKNDGTTAVEASAISPQPDASNPVLEVGYKAKFSGTYKWTAASGKKNPTVVDSASSWKDLPASGVASANYTSAVVSANTTVRVKIGAAKTGLMVSGSDVKPASGNDYKEVTRSVTFRSRLFSGVVATNSPTEAQLKALAGNELVSGRGTTKTGITATASQYYVYAYPASLGDLTGIIQDGATPVLGAFTKKTVSVTNAAGYAQSYNVYVSNNPGAFTGAKLQFS